MDLILMRIADIISAIPSMLYVILLTLVMGAGIGSMILGLCVAGWIGMARWSGRDSETQRNGICLRGPDGRDPSDAHLGGICCRTRRGTIIVNLIFLVPQAIFTEAFLSFLGVGSRRRRPAWDRSSRGEEPDDALPYQMVFPCWCSA